MRTTVSGEPAEHRAARELLLEHEMDRRRATEAVAAARRALPPRRPAPAESVLDGAGAGGALADVRAGAR
jgi:predicted dithiol-disulfide oxidoreductase (DUF899 family)